MLFRSVNFLDDTSVYILVYPKPTAMFQNSTACLHDSTKFTDLSIAPGSSIIGWYWEFGDGDTANIQNPYHTYMSTGTFNVTETVTNLSNCVDSITTAVVVRPAPNAAFTYTSLFCPGGKVQFEDQSTGLAAMISSRLWTFIPGSMSDSVNPAFVFPQPNSTYPVSLVVTDQYGCMDTVVNSVIVKPAFQLGMTYTMTCLHDSTQFHAVNLDNSPDDPLHNIQWAFGDPSSGSNTSTEKDPKHAFTGPGPFLVTLSAMNTDNCSDIDYEPVSMHALPTPGFTYENIPFCDTTVIFHFDTLSISVNLDTLVWNFGDNTGEVTHSFPFKKDTIIHHFSGQGNYIVKLIAVNNFACRDSISKVVTLTCLAAQIKDTTGNVRCTMYPVIFKDKSFPRSNINTWHWDFGDGSSRSYSPPAEDTIHHTYINPGTYTVTLTVSTVSNGNPITSSDTLTVTLNKSSIADFSVSNVCFGQPVVLKNLSDSADSLIVYYKWVLGDNYIRKDTVWEDTCSHKYAGWGYYDSYLMIHDTNGCNDTMKKRILIYKHPVARIVNPIVACARDSTIFLDNSLSFAATISKYRWTYGDPRQPNEFGIIKNSSHIYDTPGNYTVHLKVTDNHSCSDTTSASVLVYPSPISSFTFTDNTYGMPGKLLMDNQSTGANAYYWDFGNGQTSTDKNPIATYSQDGTYIIKLITNNQFNCSDTTFYKYEILFRGLFIPNAFCPSYNSLAVKLFKPVGINIKEYHIQVFDTWGHQVWESIKLDSQGKPDEGWDGTFNGQPMPQGVYLWKASAIFIDDTVWTGSDIGKGEYKTFGTVTLIR